MAKPDPIITKTEVDRRYEELGARVRKLIDDNRERLLDTGHDDLVKLLDEASAPGADPARGPEQTA